MKHSKKEQPFIQIQKENIVFVHEPGEMPAIRDRNKSVKVTYGGKREVRIQSLWFRRGVQGQEEGRYHHA